MNPINQQSWSEFSEGWNTDVKAGLAGIQAALRTLMKSGGSADHVERQMVLAVPFIRPESLRLSGGYKRNYVAS